MNPEANPCCVTTQRQVDRLKAELATSEQAVWVHKQRADFAAIQVMDAGQRIGEIFDAAKALIEKLDEIDLEDGCCTVCLAKHKHGAVCAPTCQAESLRRELLKRSTPTVDLITLNHMPECQWSDPPDGPPGFVCVPGCTYYSPEG